MPPKCGRRRRPSTSLIITLLSWQIANCRNIAAEPGCYQESTTVAAEKLPGACSDDTTLSAPLFGDTIVFCWQHKVSWPTPDSCVVVAGYA